MSNVDRIRRRLSYQRFKTVYLSVLEKPKVDTLLAIHDMFDEMRAYGFDHIARTTREAINQLISDRQLGQPVFTPCFSVKQIRNRKFYQRFESFISFIDKQDAQGLLLAIDGILNILHGYGSNKQANFAMESLNLLFSDYAPAKPAVVEFA